MKWPSRQERARPALAGLSAGIMVSMGAVSLVEVLSEAPRHTSVQVVAILGFAVGAVLQYLSLAKPARGEAER